MFYKNVNKALYDVICFYPNMSAFQCVCIVQKTVVPTINIFLITIDDSALKYFQANRQKQWYFMARQYGKYFHQHKSDKTVI